MTKNVTIALPQAVIDRLDRRMLEDIGVLAGGCFVDELDPRIRLVRHRSSTRDPFVRLISIAQKVALTVRV